MTKPILEIENLNAFFPGKQVLHDVSLTVQTGRKLALVGESGSGKTVLAQGIMRLNPLVSFEGHLKFDGNDLLTQSERALQKLRGREIGMVFQEPMTALNPVMRIGAQITEVLTEGERIVVLSPKVQFVFDKKSGIVTSYKVGGKTTRSEERRGGKECRSRWSPYH